MTNTRLTIATIPGDGIGNEVLPAATRVIDHAAAQSGVSIDWNWLDWGCDYLVANGSMMPADGIDRLSQSDAVFLGAVGRPDVADHESLWGLLIPIRRAFDQYVNLRPVRQFEGVPVRVTIPSDARIDMVIVRENTEGEYSELGGRFGRGTPREFAIQENVFTRTGIERVANYAFEQAVSRRSKLTSATKSNGIIHTMPFWDEVVDEVAAGYPNVATRKVLIDALAAELVQRPHEFDVIVASNLFGDILSDLAAATVGSLGIAASANLDPERRYPSMFEPVHGSAPDIMGKGIANPIAAIWSGAMMLEHLGHADISDRIMAAITATLASPTTRTADLGGTSDTEGVTTAVVAALGTS
jgi:tartrate dehydrogenase/decarboxylase/D-malate dehydrogenase